MGIKHISKLLVIVSILLLTLSMFCNFAYADNFDFSGYENQTAPSSISQPVKDIAGMIVSAMRIICTGIAIIMILFIAIKYLSAAPGERAELKKSAVQFVVGALVLFGASGILGIIENSVNNYMFQ